MKELCEFLWWLLYGGMKITHEYIAYWNAGVEGLP